MKVKHIMLLLCYALLAACTNTEQQSEVEEEYQNISKKQISSPYIPSQYVLAISRA